MLGTAIDVAIGIVFLFMLFSLFLSTALEAVSSVLALRARGLEITVAQLLESPDRHVHFAHWPAKGGFGLADFVYRRFTATPPMGTLVADRVDQNNPEGVEAITEIGRDITASEPLKFAALYAHPMISALPCKRPAYVPAAGFTSALIATLLARDNGLSAGIESAIASLPPGRLQQAMVTAFHDADGDLDAFRIRVEAWFDNAMDRLSGEYKRFSQSMMFALALACAAWFHLDAIALSEKIYADAPLRAALVQQSVDAVQTASSHSGPVTVHDPGAALTSRLDLFPPPMPYPSPIADPVKWLRVAAGLLATALAGMLGAPFWFDLLQKLVNLRGAGPKPGRRPATGATA